MSEEAKEQHANVRRAKKIPPLEPSRRTLEQDLWTFKLPLPLEPCRKTLRHKPTRKRKSRKKKEGAETEKSEKESN